MHVFLTQMLQFVAMLPVTHAFSQNQICRQNACVNPITPGLNDLARLELIAWQCVNSSLPRQYLTFCKKAINYETVLPAPNASGLTVDVMIKAQEDAAATSYFYHLNAMGYDPWENADPSKAVDPCVRKAWELACFTYFPKAVAGCRPGESTPYLRPCMDTCSDFMQSCNVECCDESPQCVFNHTVVVNGVSMLQTGYVDADGPAALCTGGMHYGASSSLSAPIALILGLLGLQFIAHEELEGEGASQCQRFSSKSSSGWLAKSMIGGVLIMTTITLQGCTVLQHSVGNWRKHNDYLITYQYLPPGGSFAAAFLNSCSRKTVSATEQCSGRGYCRRLNATSIRDPPLSFCECDPGWADPECRTKRKSQTTAFLLSFFLGPFGADYYYLGFPIWGTLKLLTLGGAGLWWMVDIVRTGAGPPYAAKFRCTPDLPHWVYVIASVAFFMLLAFGLSIESYLRFKAKRRADQMEFVRSEEAKH